MSMSMVSEHYSVYSVVSEDTKDWYFPVDKDLFKDDALKMGMRVADNATYAYLEESSCTGLKTNKPYGEIQKTEEGYLLKMYDEDGFISTVYDLSKDGNTTNERSVWNLEG